MQHKGNKIPNFSRNEFSEDVHKYADKWLIFRLQKSRDMLGEKIWPSKVGGALARFEYTSSNNLHYKTLDWLENEFVLFFSKTPSRHQVFKDKLSTAIDVFCDCSPFKAFVTFISSGLWGGIGVYFDTKGPDGMPHVMFHLDTREKPLMWYRTAGKYHYQGEDDFYQRLENMMFYRGR